MKKILLFSSIILFSYQINAQDTIKTTTVPCSQDAYKQFDFWLGEWTVYDTDGKKVGDNTIKKVQDGCAITENWRGVGGLNGNSLNFYNKVDSTWHQVWVDNKGNVLRLKGHFKEGKMILKSDLMKGNKINWYYNQITWSQNSDGSVTQRWETYDKENRKQSLLFLGTYRKN